MLLRELTELYNLFIFIMVNGGWILLAVALLYLLWLLYLDFIRISWYNKQKWVFLKVSVPKENEKSPLAFEQIFNQMHSMELSRTWAEAYIEGEIQIWLTWEIVSFGGTITNYIKIPVKFRDLFEASVYSQFPQAEISEAEDYFEKIPKYDPDTNEFDIFAFGLVQGKDPAYPIRTYLDFEHSTMETFVDPVTGIWEELDKLNPYEMFVVQYIFRPIKDDWKLAAKQLVKKLKGEPDALKGPDDWVGKFFGAILGPLLDIIIRPDTEVQTRKTEQPPSLMLHLTEGEKDRISAIERKLGRLSYHVKIKCLYLAPKEKFNPRPAWPAVVGAFKSVGGNQVAGKNFLKPDTKHWTRVYYYLFKGWEKPIQEMRLRGRKARFLDGMRRRFFMHGSKPAILSTEEIATILHFPQADVTVPEIEKVPVSKVKPPPELPIV